MIESCYQFLCNFLKIQSSNCFKISEILFYLFLTLILLMISFIVVLLAFHIVFSMFLICCVFIVLIPAITIFIFAIIVTYFVVMGCLLCDKLIKSKYGGRRCFRYLINQLLKNKSSRANEIIKISSCFCDCEKSSTKKYFMNKSNKSRSESETNS